MKKSKSLLEIANSHLRNRDYEAALSCYEQISYESPVLFVKLKFNLDLIEKRTGLKCNFLKKTTSSLTDEINSQFVSAEPEDLIPYEVITPSDLHPYQYITFDVWDTVLRRDCDPDEIKLRTARALWLIAANNRNAHEHPISLFWLRKEAERNVADEHYEYKIEDAFKEYLRLYMGEVESSTNELSRMLIDLEIKIEKSSTYPDSLIENLLKQLKGKKILAISDFYHNNNDLSAILEHHDLKRYFNNIYVSCDWMKTKRAGQLFDHIFELENLNPSNMFHIGDNPLADHEQARKKGVSAFLYENPKERPRLDRLKSTFEEHLKGIDKQHYENIISYLGVDMFAGDSNSLKQIKDLTNAGKVLSPIVVGFVLEIMEQAISRNCEFVYFFAREGVFFKKIYETLVDLDVYDLENYPKPKILYVSRRATFAASLSEFSIDEMMRMWNMYSTQSVEAMARSLNFDVDIVSDIARLYNLDPTYPIQYPWLNEDFKRFFYSVDLQTYANKSIKNQRAAVAKHLSNNGIDIHKNYNYLIVDIGWRGTIQDNISNLVNGKIHGVYLALKKYLNQQPNNSSKSAYLSDENTDSLFDLGDVAALEFIFNATGGSVVGYNKDGEPSTEIYEGEERIINGPVARLQDGFISGAILLGTYVRRHGLVARDLLSLSRHVVTSYIQDPPVCIADAFLSLEHNETFGTGSSDCINQSLETNYLLELDDASLHSELLRIKNQQRWSASLFNTSHFNEIFSKFRPDQSINIPCVNEKVNLFSIIRENSRRDSISIFTPRPLSGSGGHRTIFNFAKGLARDGFDVHVMVEGVNNDLWYVENELSGHDITLHTEWYAGIKPRVAIATIAHSASYVRQFHPNSIGAYFVQDYEAEFNPLSDGYVRGQNSYAQGLAPICIGHWLPHVLRNQFGIGAAYGGLGVDTDIYYPITGINRKDMVAFLYQPEKWRRMPETCIAALAIVKQRRPQTQIVLYGSDAQPNLPFEADQRGLIHDLSELNRIYNEASVGLCLSLTNPSRIPIEYMAAGCVPVDLYRYNNLFDNPTDTSLLAYQSEASIAEAILYLLENQEECNSRREKVMAIAKQRTMKWEVDAAVNAVRLLFSGTSFDQIRPPECVYHHEPIIAAADRTREVENFCRWQKMMAESVF